MLGVVGWEGPERGARAMKRTHGEGFGLPMLCNVRLFFGVLGLCWAYVRRCWRLGRVWEGRQGSKNEAASQRWFFRFFGVMLGLCWVLSEAGMGL